MVFKVEQCSNATVLLEKEAIGCQGIRGRSRKQKCAYRSIPLTWDVSPPHPQLPNSANLLSEEFASWSSAVLVTARTSLET